MYVCNCSVFTNYDYKPYPRENKRPSWQRSCHKYCGYLLFINKYLILHNLKFSLLYTYQKFWFLYSRGRDGELPKLILLKICHGNSTTIWPDVFENTQLRSKIGIRFTSLLLEISEFEGGHFYFAIFTPFFLRLG